MGNLVPRSGQAIDSSMREDGVLLGTEQQEALAGKRALIGYRNK